MKIPKIFYVFSVLLLIIISLLLIFVISYAITETKDNSGKTKSNYEHLESLRVE